MDTRNQEIKNYIRKGCRAHLVGIGGVSMRPLGVVLQEMGLIVTGSDMNSSVSTDELISHGIPVAIGHRAENIQGADCIIRTAAAHNDNPEIQAARAAGIPIFERAQAWGVIMRAYKNAICISGTHGKTTTTSMMAHILMEAQMQKFFRKNAGYPKFKSKHDNHKSYTTNFTNGNITVDFEGNRVKLPRLKGVKAKLHRKFSGQIKSATISQVPSGKYYVSVLVETEHMELPHTNQNTGIDLGIKDLCITSDGKKYENPKIIKKYEKKLEKLQRQLAHKEKRSRNYYKTRKKIALCHEKITNTRKDYLHKISNEIISENQVIVSEDLQIKNMVKNHHLAKFISDVSWYELTRQLEYKAKWNGREYIKIDTFYASSQLCSACSSQNTEIKDLSIREWFCPVCGAKHDRDINAAKNMLAEGLRQIV